MEKTGQNTRPARIEEDNHWWFAGRTWSLLNMLDRRIPPDGEARVLDIGCGAGNMFHHLDRYGSVVGVDNNPRPLVVARERGYDVRQGLAEDLPFEDETFDLVSLLDTVEHALIARTCPVGGAAGRWRSGTATGSSTAHVAIGKFGSADGAITDRSTASGSVGRSGVARR